MIGQPAEYDWPGIARVGHRDLVERRLYPSDQQRLLLGRKLFGILRRHLTESQLFLNSLPNVSIRFDMIERIESLQVKLAFLFFGGMTSHAVVA